MPEFTLPPDASRHLRDLWESRETLWNQLTDPSVPASVVVQVVRGLADIDERIGALCPEFTTEVKPPALPGADGLDEFTRRMQGAQRRAG